MTPAEAFNQEQYARWNGGDGECWSREQERLDRFLAPILAPLVEFAAPAAGSATIDIGCGCGATTLELARRVGPEGRVIAIDISEPMLAEPSSACRTMPTPRFVRATLRQCGLTIFTPIWPFPVLG